MRCLLHSHNLRQHSQRIKPHKAVVLGHTVDLSLGPWPLGTTIWWSLFPSNLSVTSNTHKSCSWSGIHHLERWSHSSLKHWFKDSRGRKKMWFLKQIYLKTFGRGEGEWRELWYYIFCRWVPTGPHAPHYMVRQDSRFISFGLFILGWSVATFLYCSAC